MTKRLPLIDEGGEVRELTQAHFSRATQELLSESRLSILVPTV